MDNKYYRQHLIVKWQITSVWTVKLLLLLSLYTVLYTSTTPSCLMRCNSISIAMKVPVRPTPALKKMLLYTQHKYLKLVIPAMYKKGTATLSLVMLADSLVECQYCCGILRYSMVWPHRKVEMFNFKANRFCLRTGFDLDGDNDNTTHQPLCYFIVPFLKPSF